MKKNITCFIITAIFFITFAGCTGFSGNPLELIGSWSSKYSETDDAGQKTKQRIDGTPKAGFTMYCGPYHRLTGLCDTGLFNPGHHTFF